MIKIKICIGLIACLFMFSGCQNNQDKITQLENEIATLKLENSALKYNSNKVNLPTSDYYGQNDSKYQGYYMYSDAKLMEAFKNYMSDEFFSYNSFNRKGKVLRVGIPMVSNVSIRSIQKKNPDIFKELLNRVDKIVFFDDFGASMTIKKMDE